MGTDPRSSNAESVRRNASFGGLGTNERSEAILCGNEGRGEEIYRPRTTSRAISTANAYRRRKQSSHCGRRPNWRYQAARKPSHERTVRRRSAHGARAALPSCWRRLSCKGRFQRGGRSLQESAEQREERRLFVFGIGSCIPCIGRFGKREKIRRLFLLRVVRG